MKLGDRLDALAQAAELARGRLDDACVDSALTVVGRAGARRSLSVEYTVAALAGATGSGKSSLFNRLIGDQVAQVGALRPTTAAAQAAVWGTAEGAAELLDWLGVPRRHLLGHADHGAGLDGLILLDLPDHDSIRVEHRMEVDRLVGLVDLLIWVVDPQKYADAAVHERYLRPLAAHRDVTLLVLNQVDRLPVESVASVSGDLRRLLLSDVPVLSVSAKTGFGLGGLRELLAGRVRDRRSWMLRLEADAAVAAARLAAPPTGSARKVESAELVDALASAAGVPVVARAVEKAHRYRSGIATGWPVTRLLRRFRPDPLRRLRLPSGVGAALGLRGVPGGGTAGRTSLPAATGVQRSRVDTALRALGRNAAVGVPEPWAAAVRGSARSSAGELESALDRAVAGTELEAGRRPLWWRVAGPLQWLVFAAMVAGALWLGALFLLGYLRLPEPPNPTFGELPWPTTLLIGGALAGVILALICRFIAYVGGRRRRRRVERRLYKAVEQVAEDLVLTPVAAERDRYRRFCELVTAARGSAAPLPVPAPPR
ncbi:GTPase [Rhizohabitans arisaemae]|uniref:GTPase n=1 Tax=Rhizohabitans arisaemae TaxID=2720610 RepID=UPI0024B06BD0|nr:GTPase [Rhizohabitans arisaemae]